MHYTLQQLATICNGKLVGEANLFVEQILTDSRSLQLNGEAIFFAISGKNHNGHLFIPKLIEKGVRCFVVERTYSAQIPEKINFIYVENSLTALQEIAEYHRNKFTLPTVAITGSNGKTVVKEWLYQILQTSKNIVRSPKSYNSQLGVPLSVLNIENKHDFALFEAGISLPNEMQNLQKIINPDFGIFTNIGDSHQENFSSIMQKIKEKLILFKNCKKFTFCADYSDIYDVVLAEFPVEKLFLWSTKQEADLRVIEILKSNSTTALHAKFNEQLIAIQIPFTDNASIENACSIWAFLLMLGYENSFIATKMNELLPVAMRMEMKAGRNNCIVINDSYSADIESFKIALDFMNQQSNTSKKTIFLSDFQQSGIHEQELYLKLSKILIQNKINRLICVGKTIDQYKECFKEIINCHFFKDTEELLERIDSLKFSNETILLKGARKFCFEYVANYLQQKTHRTILEINLSAMVENLNYFRSILNIGTKTMVMVKAFSYGAGSYEIANMLQHQRVDFLGVAFVDEGVELRKAGITLPIIVMNCDESSFVNLVKYQLEPEIYSFRLLTVFEQFLKSMEISSYPIHLKFDTGMKRLGFEEEMLSELLSIVKNNSHFRIISVFSHLVGSDDSIHNSFTINQIDKFRRMSGQLIESVGYPIIRHILNSAGIERFSSYQFDMVRLGIGLYGISSVNQRKLRNISTLKTYISQIRKVSKDETVGYSRKGKLKRETVIATVAIGYADGLKRQLSNGNGYMLVNGYAAPIIGNICMDMCMLDISGIEAQEGDEVIVFGERPSVSEIAEKLNTIPYEIMTSISQRVKKVYIQE